MNDSYAETLMNGALFIGVLFLIVLVVTLPFAFLGWIFLAVAGIFTSISYSYFDCMIAGLAIVTLYGIIESLLLTREKTQ